MIKVLLVDDHQIVLDGLSLLLEKESNIEKVGEVTDGELALKLIESLPTSKDQKIELDVIVIDIEMKHLGGIETTKIIKEKYSYIKVLILTMHDNPTFVQELLDINADGYILKNRGKEELIDAINKVNNGDKYFSHEMMIKLLNKSNKQQSQKTTEISFTKREKEVLLLIANSLSSKEIAEKLFIAESTVETHRRNLIDKSKVKNSKELIRWAIKNGYDE